jgi:hypothetical protein
MRDIIEVVEELKGCIELHNEFVAKFFDSHHKYQEFYHRLDE